VAEPAERAHRGVMGPTPSLATIRSRVAAPRAPVDPHERMLANIEGPVSPALRAALDRPFRAASVLFALVERAAGLTVLFTERAAHLKDHAGQISFPGGRIGAGETAVGAALREAHEEVGLPPAHVEVLGYLDDFLTGTGFLIKPVVGHVAAASFVAQPDPMEVASVFEVPLAYLLDPGNVTATFRERLDARFRTYELAHSGHRIWGATAAILVNFRDIVAHE
jgi:8-oxo-dGTP pyrophosphatase MutT (NUDIX family)